MISTIYELEEIVVQAWFMVLFSNVSPVPTSTLPLIVRSLKSGAISHGSWVMALSTALRENGYNLKI